jgi:hypothetical protein
MQHGEIVSWGSSRIFSRTIGRASTGWKEQRLTIELSGEGRLQCFATIEDSVED